MFTDYFWDDTSLSDDENAKYLKHFTLYIQNVEDLTK